jgi:hypothetical protein
MATKQHTNAVVPGSPRGAELAVQMLKEIESHNLEDIYHLEAEYRPADTQQQNILLQYLDAARAQGRDVEAGFAAVLTDFVAACRLGIVPNTENYRPATAKGGAQ